MFISVSQHPLLVLMDLIRKKNHKGSTKMLLCTYIKFKAHNYLIVLFYLLNK